MTNTTPTALQAKLDAAMAEVTGQQTPAPAPVQADEPVQAPQPTPQADPAEMSQAATQLAKTTTVDRQPPAEDFKHKYDVVNGMLKKTSEEKRQMAEELRILKEQVEEAQRVKPQSQPNPTTNPNEISDEEVERLINSDLLEEFGVDYWRQQIAIQRSMVQAAPQPNADPRVDTIEEKFKKQERENFYSQLDQIIPEWESINGTEQWNQFLATVEPLTGISYAGLLGDANENNDASRVAELFRTYLSKANQQPQGFNALVTPTTYAPNGVQAPAGTMTYEQWEAELKSLPSKGLSSTEFQRRNQELSDLFNKGKVTGIPGQQ